MPINRAWFEAWFVVASATPGLSELERRALSHLRDSFKQIVEKGYGMTHSHDRMAHHLGVEDPDQVRLAVYRFREKGLIGWVKRGNGRSHSYAMCLPKRLASALQANAAGADDVLPL